MTESYTGSNKLLGWFRLTFAPLTSEEVNLTWSSENFPLKGARTYKYSMLFQLYKIEKYSIQFIINSLNVKGIKCSS